MKIKHYLIASETNNYRPWITSSQALVFFIVIVWGLRFLLPSLSMATGYLDAKDLMNRINNERYQRNIITLSTNDKLITAATAKAQDMLSRSYFSHIDPDGNYVWPRIEAAGYTPYLTLGENLAMDFSSPDDLIAAWMNSPTHRANLLNEKYNDQGLALVSGQYEPGHESTIVVSLFGALSSKPIATAPVAGQSNASDSLGTLAIGSDAQVSVTQVSGHNLVDINAEVSGKPTLVTAKLLTQSITLLPQDSGRFAGTFTFNLSDNLSHASISIEARDASGAKTESTVALGDVATIPDTASASGGVTAQIPVSQQAQIFAILRIIFGVLSIIYLGFLVTDWIITKRAHIERPGMHIAPQIVVFLLVAFVNLFAKF